jgi:uncharacterized repeat protein (TIGR01451 family)
MKGKNNFLALGGAITTAFFLVAFALFSPNQAAPVAAQGPGIKVSQGPVVIPHEFRGDVRALPQIQFAPPRNVFRPIRRPPPNPQKQALSGTIEPEQPSLAPEANMPAPIQNFAGLSHDGSCTGGPCGDGYPPDPNGDVGPNHYMQAVNTSIGIFSKTGTQLAAFTYNDFWADAGTGTPCDNSHQGDPIVLYDPLGDRFLFMDFAFTDANANTGPYYFCFAVSQTGDPLGSYWFYPVRADDDTHPWFPDYPKGGVWPDGFYFSANMFQANTFKEVRAWAFNRTQMESGQPLESVVMDTNSAIYFTMLPSNVRGAQPPAGTPNYFVSEDQLAFAFDVFEFQAIYGGPGSSFTGPVRIFHARYAIPTGAIVPQPDTLTRLDSLGDGLMMQNQYRNIGGMESLWLAHTIRKSLFNSLTGIQWAQIDVTGGTLNTTPVQQQNYFPDSTLYRWLPSLAVDRFGNMAVGYSVSSSSTYPGIRYAGRLSGDPLGTLPQSETTLVNGGGSQIVNCGGLGCNRWGDYSAMTVDPVDGCTFWYTNEYYVESGGNWNTRIGSFKFPACTASPPLTLSKTASQASYTTLGQVISYTLAVTNNTEASLSDVSITDTILSSLNCTPGQPAALASGALLTCTGSYTITQADLDAGSITNTASATAIFGGSPVTSNLPSAVVVYLSCPGFVTPPVDAADIQVLAARWRENVGVGSPYDFDGDGVVTVVDVMWLAARWGSTSCQ